MDWVCDECGSESDSENATCDCEDTCTQHTATIKLLRANADRLKTDRDEAQHKLSTLAEQHTELEKELATAKAALAMVRTNVAGVWLWQGDGHDHPESLSCPVVMGADILDGLRRQCEEALADRDLVERELREIRALINSPRTDDFIEAVRVEAAHQVQRWGVEHDAGKRPEDWITLYAYLLGKAARAHFDGNREKLLHHIITVAAVALNWHRNATGDDTRMRPGVASEALARE